MKRFKVMLSIGGMTFVHAERYENEGPLTRFFRGDSVVAEFATVSVHGIEHVRTLEDPPTTRGGRQR
jgi:hypothetical protein